MAAASQASPAAASFFFCYFWAWFSAVGVHGLNMGGELGRRIIFFVELGGPARRRKAGHRRNVAQEVSKGDDAFSLCCGSRVSWAAALCGAWMLGTGGV